MQTSINIIRKVKGKEVILTTIILKDGEVASERGTQEVLAAMKNDNDEVVWDWAD